MEHIRTRTCARHGVQKDEPKGVQYEHSKKNVNAFLSILPSEARSGIWGAALYGRPQKDSPPAFRIQYSEDSPQVFSLRQEAPCRPQPLRLGIPEGFSPAFSA